MLESLRCVGAIAVLAMSVAFSAAADTACPQLSNDAAAASDPVGAEAQPTCESPHVWTSSFRSGGGEGVTPDSIHPYRALRAMAHPFRLLALWAQGQEFHLSRRSALYDWEGGAAIPLDDHVRFTASYRISGVDLGFDSDIESADVEPSIQATFVGFAFDF